MTHAKSAGRIFPHLSVVRYIGEGPTRSNGQVFTVGLQSTLVGRSTASLVTYITALLTTLDKQTQYLIIIR